MAFSFGFFNSKNLDRTYTAENFNEYLSSIICDGIQDNFGQAFKLTKNNLQLTVGSGKAWIDGHYFVSDSPYTIDLSKYADESLPRYVTIGICCNTGENYRNIAFEILPGTPESIPSIPHFFDDTYRTYLTICTVLINAGADELEVSDYRGNELYCGYVKCILGKCRVTSLMQQLLTVNAVIDEVKKANDELQTRISELEVSMDDYCGEITETGRIGENAFYTLYGNGTLLIKGTGETMDYDLSSNRSPFYENDAIKKIVVSGGITRVGDATFYKSQSLTEVRFSNTVNSVGWCSFGHCSRLKAVNFPSSLTKIGSMAFSNINVSSITIPRTVKVLSKYAFQQSWIYEVRIESETVGNTAFTQCTSLRDVTVGASVKKLGDSVFAYCTNIKSFVYEGSIEGWNSITKPKNWFSGSDSFMPVIQCLDGHLEYDKENKTWNEVKNSD